MTLDPHIQKQTDPYAKDPHYIYKGESEGQFKGRTVTVLNYAEKIEVPTRIWEGIAALFITLISLFTALAIPAVRRMWSEALTGEGKVSQLFKDTISDPRGRHNKITLDESRPHNIRLFDGSGMDSMRAPFSQVVLQANGQPFEYNEGDYSIPVLLERVDLPPLRINIPGSLLDKLKPGETFTLKVEGKPFHFQFDEAELNKFKKIKASLGRENKISVDYTRFAEAVIFDEAQDWNKRVAPFLKSVRDANGREFEHKPGDYSIPVEIQRVGKTPLKTYLPGSVIRKLREDEPLKLLVDEESIVLAFEDKDQLVLQLEDRLWKQNDGYSSKPVAVSQMSASKKYPKPHDQEEIEKAIKELTEINEELVAQPLSQYKYVNGKFVKDEGLFEAVDSSDFIDLKYDAISSPETIEFRVEMVLDGDILIKQFADKLLIYQKIPPDLKPTETIEFSTRKHNRARILDISQLEEIGEGIQNAVYKSGAINLKFRKKSPL